MHKFAETEIDWELDIGVIIVQTSDKESAEKMWNNKHRDGGRDKERKDEQRKRHKEIEPKHRK